MMQPCARWGPVIGFLFLAATGYGELRDRVMVLDESHTSVREIHDLKVNPGRQVLRFPDLPRTLDPETLELRARRGRLSVRSWSPISVSVPEEAPWGWPPPSASPPARLTSGWAAECEVNARGELTVELHYLCRNVPWSAHYNVDLRFARDLQEEVSCDVRVQLQVANPMEVAFSDTLLRLLQPLQSPRGASALVDGPGFLSSFPAPPPGVHGKTDLDESPIRRTYRLPDRVTLEPLQSIHVTWLDHERARGTRVYRCRAGGAPGQALGRRFHQIIRIHNTEENGLGMALPAGSANVFAADSRRPLTEAGPVAQTEAGEYLELDLGPTEDLVFEESPRMRGPWRQGLAQVRVQVRVTNHLPFVAPVHWEHDPDSSLQWRLLKSNVDHQISGGRLGLTCDVPAKGSRMLDFTLEFVQPAL